MTKAEINNELNIGPNMIVRLGQISAPFAIVNWSDLSYVFANKLYCELLGYEQIAGKKVEDVFSENLNYPNLLRDAISEGKTFHYQQSSQHQSNKSIRCFDLSHFPIRNQNGVIDGIMIVGEEVKKIEKKDDQNALHFRNFVDNSSDAVVILIGEDLVLDVANDAVLKLWGVNRDVIGKRFLDILPEMKEQGFHHLLMDVYKNGITHYGYETAVSFRRADGSDEIHYFNFVYQPYRGESGIISGVFVVASDVTENVIVKQQLEKSQTNFRNMILQAPVAMCILAGPHHVVEIANDHMFELWGKSAEAISGKPIFEGLPEVRGQGFEQLLSSVYTTGQRVQANEQPVQLPRNGVIETVYVKFLYEPYYDGDGSISGIIAVATDVTDQVLSRQRIEYAEENARLAIESADLGTYEINLQTNEMFTSSRFNAIWGFDELTTIRSKFASVIHPDDLGIREEAHKNSIITGSLEYEARILWKDGSYRWVRIKGKVLYDKANTPMRLLGVIQDITEQKQFAAQLTKKVEERTKALQEANYKLEQTNQELEQFAYVTSHDLQEPLRKIRFYASNILDNNHIERAKSYIEKINNSAQRMSDLIKSLLEYSRLSQRSEQFEAVDLNSIVKDVITDFELLIEQKQAVVHVEKLSVIEAIPLQINQLFFNLIGNALKFNRRNIAPILEIKSQKVAAEKIRQFPELDENKEYVEIQITDNGIGFHQEYADKIFTIFQRLNESSSYKGYGIGLALCKKIIANHSGIIYAKSNVGEGASFIFILPYTQT